MNGGLERSWPEWYEIIHNDGCTPAFGNCMLFYPHRLPQSDSCELLTDIILLCNPDCHLLGIFTFKPRSDIIKLKQYLARSVWEVIFLLCSSICIIPLISSFSITSHPIPSGKLVHKPRLLKPTIPKFNLIGQIGFQFQK